MQRRIAKSLAAIVGLFGIYLAVISLITAYGAIQAGAMLLLLVTLPMLIVGSAMVIFCYQTIFMPTETSNRNIAAIYSIMVLLYSGVLIEPLISENEIVINPRVIASGSAIILAIAVYYGVKLLLNIEKKEHKET
jgi:hypothetical protein